ncbi:RHS repeat-associated core domain-containing protein [Butyrivibrio hungatei]|uniref:RHS repeat domain-containing protein n=2 Tax=Butyrivibrio TaxID=830 RepID=UPI0004058508
MAYEYGATGERTKLTYPDGREVTYNYDEKLQLSSIIGNGEETRYTYDDLGRLSSKTFANGVTQGYTYMLGGNLASMESSDKQGVLDKYFYSYNKAGLIDGIDRNRRGLDKVSGRYEYSYDAIGRLTKTTHDGITKAAYEYDAFGNRTAMSEIFADTSENIKTAYTYDVLDRLIETKELNSSQAILKTYDYDNRGNQTKEFINGILQKSFTFDATNMLSKVIDKDKGELENFYNGLGFRVTSTRPEERIEYLCDLSKDYYNLLERTVNGETESFVYDNNVISMSKSGNNYYYLQDELGSPMYMTGTDGAAVSAYAFDDFGRNIDPFTGKVRNNRKHNVQKHAYTTSDNIVQPFAFTGYQEDEVSGLKFAQARFYSADNGRFIGEDQVRGFEQVPETQNHYLYCLNTPIIAIDRNGKLLHLLIGAAVGGFVNGGLEYLDQKLSGEEIDWKKVRLSAAQGAIEGTAIATGCAGLAMGVQFVTDAVFNNAKDSLDGELTTEEKISNVIGAGVNALAVGGMMKATGILAKNAPKIANKLFQNGQHPVLEKIASEFIAQGEMVNDVNGIKDIAKGIGKNTLDSIAKYAFSYAPDAMEAAKMVFCYTMQEHVIDFAYNRITAGVDSKIDNLVNRVGGIVCEG